MSQPSRRFSSRRRREPQHPGSDYLIVGQVTRPHGVRGEVMMKVITEYPERLLNLEHLFLGSQCERYTLQRARSHRKGMLLQFEEVTDRDQAENLREQYVYVHVDDAVPLEDGEYYLFQIEGIRVVSDEGEELGHLTGFIETGANDVYEVTADDGSQILLPAIPQVIQKVDLDTQVMTVHLLEGLI